MLRSFCIIVFIVFFSSALFAHSHTYIGRNSDGIWGNTDDNQLWIFATPDQPQWDTIEMLPSGEFIGSKQIYIAELDCWHSAYGDDGLYQLDSNDELTQPDWRIELKRISYSDPVNFWMEDEATTLEIFTSDGAIFAFEEPDWDDELGVWHFHNHTEFFALADGTGETFAATFTVLDTGLTNFTQSQQFTINFITVPEPACIVLFSVALAAVRKFGKK